MPKTLLLADDSVTIQKVVGISFANEDVELVTVDNGDDAVARARALRPDIVLADVVMPGMNGYEVCEAIKADPELRHIPVLLLTGTFEAFDEARAARVRADGHITKPFEAQALVDTVNARLAQAPRPEPAAQAAPEPAAVAREEVQIDVAEPREEGYDFFDEEETEPGRGRPDPAGTTTVLMSGDLAEADARDAFAFDAPEELPSPARGDADAPVRRGMPFVADEEDEGATTTLFAEADFPAEPTPPTAEAPALSPFDGADEPAMAREDDGLFGAGFEPAEEALELEPDAPAALSDSGAVMPEELDAEAILDPAGGRDYDVSSSDLGDPLAATPPVSAHAAPPAAPAPVVVAPAAPPSPVEVEPRPAADAFGPGPGAPARAVAPAAPAPELSAAVRQQLHDALEKIAWEAFSDVSERIVKEALERIERVAWEVIPQMTEVLVREEIRRLKEED